MVAEIATATAAPSSNVSNFHNEKKEETGGRPGSTSSNTASDLTRRMVCGGLAGMIAKTATNPLDRIRMLAQTGEHGMGNTSGGGNFLPIVRNILRLEGVLGLWAGNGANLLRVFPAKAVVFSSNDVYQNFLRSMLLPPPPHPTATSGTSGSAANDYKGLISFAAGGMSGMTATAATYPLDLARGRITGKLATGKNQKAYKGIVSTLLLTARDEGVLALYRGMTPTLLGAIPYEGIKFGTVGLLEKYFPVNASATTDDGGNNQGTNALQLPLRKMCMGGMGGVMAGLLTYPNDTVRRLLQLQGSRGTSSSYKGYWDCVKQTYQNHGIGRFYKGVGINIVRMAPNTAVQFGSYELLKQWTADLF